MRPSESMSIIVKDAPMLQTVTPAGQLEDASTRLCNNSATASSTSTQVASAVILTHDTRDVTDAASGVSLTVGESRLDVNRKERTGKPDIEAVRSIEKDDLDITDNEVSSEPPDGGFTAWMTVVASFTVHLLSLGLLYSFGVYGQYYYASGLDSLSIISFVGSIGAACLVGFGILSGRLAEKFGYRPMIFIGTVIMSLGLILASYATKTWHLMVTQGFLFGLGSSLAYFPAVSVPSQWFAKKRGIATGIAVSGSGIGGLLMSQIIQKLIPTIGVQWTLRASGILTFVGLTAILPLIKTRIPPSPNSKTDWSVLKDAKFLLMLGMVFFATFPSFIPVIYLPTFAVSQLGVSSASGATLVSIFNGSSAAGRILLGIAADTFLGRANALMLCMFLSASSMLFLWTFANSYALLILFAAVNGFVCGGFISLFPVIVGTMFGVQHLASLVGMLMSISAIGNLAGPPLGGVIKDSIGYAGLSVFAGGITVISFGFTVAIRFRLDRTLIKAV
ncbi:major facilitator superfamily domain-containing protein [Chytriomyces sp. MP71]|nr:major facilitator superfamily domain-containing protein [Chytriomyces sp. MP71]